MRHIQAPAGARTVDSRHRLFASTEVAHTIFFTGEDTRVAEFTTDVRPGSGRGSGRDPGDRVADTILLVGFVADWVFATNADAIRCDPDGVVSIS